MSVHRRRQAAARGRAFARLAAQRFFDQLRDREVLLAIVGEVAGPEVAAANAGEKGKAFKAIVSDCLEGANGRAKAEPWVPQWLAFPPSTYTLRGGVGSVKSAARVRLSFRPTLWSRPSRSTRGMPTSIRLSQPENMGRAASVARLFLRGGIGAPVWTTGAALSFLHAPLPQAASARGCQEKGGVRSPSRRPSTMYASQNIAPPPPSRRVGRNSDRSAEDFVPSLLTAPVSQDCRNPTGFRANDCNSSQFPS